MATNTKLSPIGLFKRSVKTTPEHNARDKTNQQQAEQ